MTARGGPGTPAPSAAHTVVREIATATVEASPSVAAKAPAPQGPATSTVPAGGLVVAWQPSHQNDTGAASWREYVICGDIVDRAIAAMPSAVCVKAWDVSKGLTGSNNYRPKPTNTPAFDAEVAKANRAGADVFVAVHVDGGAPSGILGECLPGDAAGRRLCEALVRSLVKRTGLPDRGVREVRLYSLESVRNRARFKCLLEIGDNKADRAFLSVPANRKTAAEAMAAVLRDWR